MLHGRNVAQGGKFVHQQQALVLETRVVFRQPLLHVYVYQLAKKQVEQTAKCDGFGGNHTDINGHPLLAHAV